MWSIHSDYYILVDEKTYKMYITGDLTLIGRWYSMVKGNVYPLKINNTYAAFCDQKILGVGK